LIGRFQRKKTRTTFPDPEAQAVDLVKRAFGPGTVEVDRVYVGDITYSAQLKVMCSALGRAGKIAGRGLVVTVAGSLCSCT
jgi:hypothetical protein